jgi:cytochrome c oxidase subunit 1
MHKRLAYILVAGLVMAMIFWLLFWIHRMFVLGLNPFLDIVFIAFVILILLPGIIWGVAKLCWPAWELFAVGCACWIWWAVGRILLIGRSTLDIHRNDTFYIVSGTHYLLLLPLTMLVFTAIYYFLERRVGYVNRALGRIHFWVTFIGLWYLIWPGDYEGLAGLPRRYLDISYSHSYFHGFNRLINVNHQMETVAMGVLFMQAVFVGMVVYSVTRKFFTRLNN